MRIKTYVFDDVKEGMNRIKEEYGLDTIIVDIKNNGATSSRKGCEISIAVEGEKGLPGDDQEDLRRKMEGVWDHAAKYVGSRIGSMEMEMMRDRVKSYPLPLRAFFDKMVRNGFDGRTALTILSEIYCTIGSLAEDSPKAIFFVKRGLGSRIKVHNPIYSSAPIVVLGPSGAGKTETVKKLAWLCNREALKVSVIALQPSRKGAADDLRAFSEERGIPFSTASEEEIPARAASGESRKIVDLSGTMDQQKRVAKKLGQSEKIMVLPAGARDEKMKACCEAFGGQDLHGLIFTKLDEEETVGHIFDNLIRLSLPLSFFTTGSGEKDIVTPNNDLLYKILIEGNSWKRRENALLQ